MQIEKVELRLIELDLIEPFETSFGKEANRAALIVSMEAEGRVGYGECVAAEGPWYSYETTQTAWHLLEEYMIPAILEKELNEPEELLAHLGKVRGHNMAKASLEMAFWDLSAKLKKVSLSKMLDGTKAKIESGISIGIQKSIAELLKRIAGYLEQGYRRIKIKIKPGWDLEIVQAVREKYPDILLMADANSAYTLEDLPLFKKLEQFNLLMIEQPLSYDDLVDHARLQRELKTPLCLDESIKGLADVKTALKLGSCRIINIKPGRVGGLLNSKLIADFCQENDIKVWCGGMLETGIGRAHNVALASLPSFSLPNDISASSRYYKEDLVEPDFKLNPDGTITVPQGHGLGVEVIQERLEKATVKCKAFSS